MRAEVTANAAPAEIAVGMLLPKNSKYIKKQKEISEEMTKKLEHVSKYCPLLSARAIGG